MRALVFALVLLFASAAQAEYKLRITEDQVIHNPEEWEIASDAGSYKIYVLKESTNSTEKYPIVYTVVELVPPREMIKSMPKVLRIYTAGIMECPNQLFNLMDEYYVDENNRIVYVRLYDTEESVVEMRTPGTARRAVYEKVCAH